MLIGWKESLYDGYWSWLPGLLTKSIQSGIPDGSVMGSLPLDRSSSSEGAYWSPRNS